MLEYIKEWNWLRRWQICPLEKTGETVKEETLIEGSH